MAKTGICKMCMMIQDHCPKQQSTEALEGDSAKEFQQSTITQIFKGRLRVKLDRGKCLPKVPMYNWAVVG